MKGRGEGVEELLASDACTVPASVFDPLSGRMAKELGYSCAVLPGSSVALHHLGVPDITLISERDVVDLSRRIKRVMSIPLIVDGDHGFGNAINARRFTEDLAAAGVAAVTLEDTWLPRRLSRNTHPGVPLAEACAKIRAAVDGAAGTSLRVIARTSTTACPDATTLIQRLRAFEQTGAEALFISGLKDWATLEAAAAQTKLPLVLGARAPALEDIPRLAANRVRIALSCQSVTLAAYRGAWDKLADNAPVAVPVDDFPTLIDRLSGGPDYRDQAERYSVALQDERIADGATI